MKFTPQDLLRFEEFLNNDKLESENEQNIENKNEDTKKIIGINQEKKKD